ncbi:MAG: CarD family transcriptional regulator, partial [Candidatus Binatia bacterium]
LARLHAARPRPVLAIAPDTTGAEAFAADLRFYRGDREGTSPLERHVHVLPGWEIPPFEPLSPTRETVAARMEGFHHLLQTSDPIIVTTIEAWGQRGLPRAVFGEAITYVVTGEAIAPATLVERLVGWGYHRVPLVQDPGDVALRGGILDVHPAGYTRPVRFEFFGDDIESIRVLDAVSQRSLDRVEDVLLLPLREFAPHHLGAAVARVIDARAAEVALARQERRDLVEAVRSGFVLPGMEGLLPYLHPSLGTLADFLPERTLVWVLQGSALETGVEATWQQVVRHAEAAEAEGRFHCPTQALYLAPAEWRARLGRWPRIEVEGLESLVGDDLRAMTYSTDGIALRGAATSDAPLKAVADRLHEWQRDGARLVVVATTPARRDRLRALLVPYGIDALATDAPFGQALSTKGRGPLALTGDLSCGVRLPADGLAVATEAEFFGEPRQIRRGRRERPADVFSSLAALKPDDYVVHVDHGVALYRGLKHMLVAKTAGDYLHLEYDGGDRLYVPVDRINVVQRYVSADGGTPPLDKLGGTSWERVKARAKESLLAMAHELLQVYAAREAHGRRPYAQSDPLYQEFVARFP